MTRSTRYALTLLAVDLVPVPVLDTWLANRVRRRLVRGEARRAGRDASEAAVVALADDPLWSWRRLAMWPVKKVVGKLLLPIAVLRSLHDTATRARAAASEDFGHPQATPDARG